MRYFWLTYTTLVLLVLANNLVGCSSAQQQHTTLNTITDIADPTYRQVVDTCDDMRDAIVAREGTTRAQDERAMSRINAVCDAIILSFEALRTSQLTARAYIDSGLEAAAAQAIQEGLQSWNLLRGMIDQLQDLGTEEVP